MRRHDNGPRRSGSRGSYLRQTRLLAALAIAGVVLGVASDATRVHFWVAHPLLAGLAANVIVVSLSVALLNEAIQSRSRRRWRVLAQYVMFELAHNARILCRELARSARASDQLVGRWAGVMLNADSYAEIIDRHVELAGDLAWLKGLVAGSGPAVDLRRRRARFNRAIRLGGEVDEQWLADRVLMITQLAEEVERSTFKTAFRIVPVEWWQSRLGTTAPSATVRGGHNRP